MSRQSRVDQASKPLRAANWQGAARDQTSIDRWIDRASAHSDKSTRSTDKEVYLPPTGGKTDLRDTSLPPRTNSAVDRKMEGQTISHGGTGAETFGGFSRSKGDGEAKRRTAKADLNHEGSDYMKSIRRNA